jgi:hypothetical protein
MERDARSRPPRDSGQFVVTGQWYDARSPRQDAYGGPEDCFAQDTLQTFGG